MNRMNDTIGGKPRARKGLLEIDGKPHLLQPDTDVGLKLRPEKSGWFFFKKSKSIFPKSIF